MIGLPNKQIGIIDEKCGPILQHLFFDIEPYLILCMFMKINPDKWSINGKTNNQAFKWYL